MVLLIWLASGLLFWLIGDVMLPVLLLVYWLLLLVIDDGDLLNSVLIISALLLVLARSLAGLFFWLLDYCFGLLVMVR